MYHLKTKDKSFANILEERLPIFLLTFFLRVDLTKHLLYCNTVSVSLVHHVTTSFRLVSGIGYFSINYIPSTCIHIRAVGMSISISLTSPGINEIAL